MLKWNGSGFLDGVPARDLNEDELDQYGGKEFLLGTGLYAEEASTSKPKSKKQPSSEETEVKKGE